MTDNDSITGRIRQYVRVGGPFFSLSPIGGEGWGEGAASDGRFVVETLTLPPPPFPPPLAGEGQGGGGPFPLPQCGRGAFIAGGGCK